ncbi:MAG: hypothetical protein ACXIUL_01420 [Wenzhouxiangella sp.]
MIESFVEPGWLLKVLWPLLPPLQAGLLGGCLIDAEDAQVTAATLAAPAGNTTPR